MSSAGHYLASLRGSLGIDSFLNSFKDEDGEIIDEIKTHIEDRVEELKESGLSEEEATRDCLGRLGSVKLIARQIYEAHSQGSWKQAALAAMPHLVFGALFALNWWQHLFWLAVVIALVVGTTIYGWWHSKPNWVFPWLGYSLVPVAVAGLLLPYLPKGLLWVAIALYIPLAAWWLYYLVQETMRRDWLFGPVMLLPAPIIAGWFLAVEPNGQLNQFTIQRVYDFAPWIGLSFITLALTIAAFIRLRQQWVRAVLLITSGLLMLVMVAYYAEGRLSLPAFLLLLVGMLALFLIPALLERRIKSSYKRRFQQFLESY